MKRIALVLGREWLLFYEDPYIFFLGKRDLVFENLRKKTQEQKVLLSVTIIFFCLDSFILFSDYFLGEKALTYISFLAGQSVLKFLILTRYNFNHFWHNVKTALPYVGGIYALYFFLKKK